MSAKPSKIYFRAQQGKKPSTGERSELRRNGWPRSGIGMAGMNKNFWRPRRTDDQKWHDFIWGFPKVFHIFAILSFFLVYIFWNFVKNLHVVFYWKFPKLFFFHQNILRLLKTLGQVLLMDLIFVELGLIKLVECFTLIFLSQIMILLLTIVNKNYLGWGLEKKNIKE